MPTIMDIGLKKLSSNTLILSNTIKAIGNLANQASYSLEKNKGFYEELINSKIIESLAKILHTTATNTKLDQT